MHTCCSAPGWVRVLVDSDDGAYAQLGKGPRAGDRRGCPWTAMTCVTCPGRGSEGRCPRLAGSSGEDARHARASSTLQVPVINLKILLEERASV
jgi:hypothetical protein